MSTPKNEVIGTQTFLFSDIEGSTRMLQALGSAYAAVLEQHRRILTTAVETAGGHVFGSEGDALFSAFTTAGGAITAAADAQRGLAAHEWPEGVEVRVRMGIHTGEAMLTDGDYVGLSLHQVARITAAGHGGQVLVSETTRRLLANLPDGLELRDLGERRLKDLTAPERIHQLLGAGLAERFPALRTLDMRSNNLPTQLTSFVGRAELAVARDALADTRLLTLTGPGGTGKTRLALQLAADTSDQFNDGVYFVALDSVIDVNLVASVIASTLGLNVSGGTTPLDALVDHLRDKQLLLVLDNFEQIVDAAPDVSRILHDAPGIKVIVTTRIGLRIYGERELPVPPLGMPPESLRSLTALDAQAYEAVDLFVERATAALPSFRLTDENAPLVVDIVRRLDGLPLAIELAASRTRALPVAAIHARLDQHLSLLTGGSRDLPGRQQTLRGAIDWSFDLLEGPDRLLFERFSIHSGGAFLTQADAICGPAADLGEDVLDGLSSLADKSLVKPDLASGEDPRFAMLVTIRDYAHERLAGGADYDALARRHADVYLALAEAVADELTGPQGGTLTDRLEQDHDNLRAALDWAAAHAEVEFALRFIVAVWRFWQVRGHLDEGRRRIDLVMQIPGIEEQPPELLARAYGAAGSLAYWQADQRATHRYYGLALEAARATADDLVLANALYNFGFAPMDQDLPTDESRAAGRPFWEESLALYRRLDNEKGIADSSWGLAQAFAAAGDMASAGTYGEEALAAYRKLKDPFRIGWGLFMLAGLRVSEGGLEIAEVQLRESIAIFAAARDQSGILLHLAGFLYLAERRGQSERAYRLGGATETLRATSGGGLLDAPVGFVEFSLPEKPIGDAEAIRAWEAGARLTPEEAVAYALEEPQPSAE